MAYPLSRALFPSCGRRQSISIRFTTGRTGRTGQSKGLSNHRSGQTISHIEISNNNDMTSVPPFPSAAAAATAGASAAAAAPISASFGVSNDDDDDWDLRRVPFFTAEEELQEIASLTISDIAKIQSDLSGLSSILVSLQPSSSAAVSGPGGAASLSAQVGIAQTNIELSQLPQSATAAYYRAVERCPSEAGPDRTLVFLEAENHDPKAAAVKLAKYWEARVALFGEERAYLPMTLAGAMKEEAMNLATRRIWQLLTATDAAGRAIVLMSPSRRNFAEYSIEQEYIGLWYLMETICQDPNLRKRGYILLIDTRTTTLQHSNKKTLQLFSLITSVMPTPLKGIHICYTNAIVTHLIIPVVKRLLPTEYRLRVKVHSGSTNEVLTSLSGYCLPPDRVPTDMGGLLVVDNPAWMVKRLTLETVRENPLVASSALAGLSLPAPVSTTTSSLVAAAAVHLQQQQQQQQQSGGTLGFPINVATLSGNGIGAVGAVAPQIPANVGVGSNIPLAGSNSTGHFSDLTDRQLYDRIVQERQTNSIGRNADPRMNRALVLSLEDPNLPRLDALVAGGFQFGASRAELEMVSPTAIKDSENVSLRQRRDQLSRRLREVRKWIKQARDSGSLVNDHGNEASANAGSNAEAASALLLMQRYK